MLRISLICVGIIAILLAFGPTLWAAQLDDVTIYRPYMVAQLTDTDQNGTAEEPDSVDGVNGTTEPETADPGETDEPTAPPPAESTPYPAPEPEVTSPTEPGPPAQPGVPAPTEPTAPGVTPPEPAPVVPEPEVGAGPSPEAQEPVGAGPAWEEPYFGEDRAALPRAGTGSGWLSLSGAALAALGVVTRRRRR